MSKLLQEQKVKMRMKNENLAERAARRRQKWLRENSKNDSIASSKYQLSIFSLTCIIYMYVVF